MNNPLLQAKELTKQFGKNPPAVDHIDLTVEEGECVGIVGESGSGKSTLLRLLNGILTPEAGTVRFRGSELTSCTRSELRNLRQNIQMIFQDPRSSLNPRMCINELLCEPLRIQKVPRTEWNSKVADMLEAVHLPTTCLSRYPHEFSGGQLQRIGIARALILDPALVLADEPVASLDVSIQAQILNLLAELRQRTGCSMVFVAHDLPVVQAVSDRVAVMRQGRIVETLQAEDLFQHAQHPYTRTLIEATRSV
jgi:ABC-type oligopeptide transport system ATPase subunit